MTLTLTYLDVPYVDLAAQNRSIRSELLAAAARVIEHGQMILGPEVQAFERAFAEYCGCAHAVGVSNGTAAITLTLRALEIGRGHEVITAGNSFLASASAIALAGATPVLADVGDDENLDPESVQSAITRRTRAILAVHLRGRPARMKELTRIAQKHNLHLLEDAAQAVGASIDNQPVGSLGVAGCFSLHPLKNLGALGDAGIITTQDNLLADRLRTLRNHGLVNRDECETWSTNDRLDAMQAAMLLTKLKHLDHWTITRRQSAAHYTRHLRDLVQTPAEAPGQFAVYHTYTIQTDRRDALQASLASHGVETKIHYPIPIHRQAAFGREASLPNVERHAGRILSLPIHPELSPQQLDHVVRCVRAFFGV